MNVAIIGASNKPERYSYKALKLLQEHGHRVFAVHPRIRDIENLGVYRSIAEIHDTIDTVTLYVAADISDRIGEDIIAKHPRRIIFNPGAENPVLRTKAEERGIECLDACTLVLLKTKQF